MMRACVTCGRAFEARHRRHRHCPAHEPRGRINASPTTQAQDGEYSRNRRIVLQRDAGKACPLCGQPGPLTEVDHIIPVARGGTHDIANLQAVHPSCNYRKGDRPAVDHQLAPSTASPSPPPLRLPRGAGFDLKASKGTVRPTGRGEENRRCKNGAEPR